MLKQKKKFCKSCGDECFLYSRGRCKACASKEDAKPLKKSFRPIKKVSEKQKEKNIVKKELTIQQFEMFREIWEEREHICQSCGKQLYGEPLSLYFDHLLEKSQYKELTLVKENIYICCGDCHSAKTNGFPTQNHKIAIEKAKLIFNKN